MDTLVEMHDGGIGVRDRADTDLPDEPSTEMDTTEETASVLPLSRAPDEPTMGGADER